MRITAAREQYDLLLPWREADVAVHPDARPPGHPGMGNQPVLPKPPAPNATQQPWMANDWRGASDGGAFHSSVRPPMASDVPHPSELPLHPARNRKLIESIANTQDPENDPYGVLNGTGMTFEDLVNNHVSHLQNANPDQAFKGRVWYRAAHDATKDLADKTTGDHTKAVATFSAFSPRKDWDENIEHGMHFLTHYDGDPNFDMPTMKGQIDKAKKIYHGEDPGTVLGGPKTKAFLSNILDPTDFRPARGGDPNDEGFYEHPVNPASGERDWRMHPDQETTVDTHHARAQVTPHGSDLNDLRYATPPHFDGYNGVGIAGQKYDLGYDLHSRASWEATRRFNEQQQDPAQHLTPKQSQAQVWLKFKDDVDGREAYRRNTPAPGEAPATYDPSKKNWGLGPLTNPIPRYQQDSDTWQDPRRPKVDLRQTPNWQRRSMISGRSTWHDMLDNWIAQRYPHMAGGQVVASRIDRELMAYVDELLAASIDDYRAERARQETELEGLTGGYATDTADYFARGGKPLINYKEWLRSQKISDGEQAARDALISREPYTPHPSWAGGPPAW